MRSQRGFTLLEMLLVLSVLSLLLLVTVPISGKWVQQTTEKEALQAFMSVIYDMQAYSIAHQVFTQLEFKNNGTEYIATLVNKEHLAAGKFPEGMALNIDSPLKSIAFKPGGDIVKAGRLLLITTQGDKKIHLQIVRGRMILHE